MKNDQKMGSSVFFFFFFCSLRLSLSPYLFCTKSLPERHIFMPFAINGLQETPLPTKFKKKTMEFAQVATAPFQQFFEKEKKNLKRDFFEDGLHPYTFGIHLAFGRLFCSEPVLGEGF